ncbi:MAG TPA: Rho termination factor N-terminal domain-containing protein [Solirubrobacterales bacterium]|nr:Rho termination factor N-terminal domain-containing protein [Solirubrobacterales bacterium]
MNKAELESKHLSDLHALAAEAGVERYRMLSRNELIEKLAGGGSGGGGSAGGSGSGGSGGGGSRGGSGRSGSRPGQRDRSQGGRSQGGRGSRERPQRERSSSSDRERPPRRRRSREGQGDALADEALDGGRESGRESRPEPKQPERAPEPTPPATPAPPPPAAAADRPRRKRRRRRFGRRKEGVTIQDLLLPPAAGRQAILAAETREACTALLRGVAADLAADSNGPDPVVLLIDPSPEELADWKREAPKAEIVAAGQARHASDALAQAATRASSGEDVMLLVDSLTRLAEAYGDADSAKEFFDAGRVQAGAGNGSLTVVAAIERPAQ